MEKSTKLIVAAIGLGGLGYFLYKRGLFSNKTSEVKMPLGLGVQDVIVDTGKKTAVELTKDCVQEGYDCTKKTYNTIQIPIDADCNEYQPAMPQCAPSPDRYEKPYEPIGFRDNTYYDQPTRIDYGTGKYNQEVPDSYMERDIVNARFNQYLYA